MKELNSLKDVYEALREDFPQADSLRYDESRQIFDVLLDESHMLRADSEKVQLLCLNIQKTDWVSDTVWPFTEWKELYFLAEKILKQADQKLWSRVRLSESEKRRRNPTYRTARKTFTTNALLVFPIWGVLLLLMIFLTGYIENRGLGLLIGLLTAVFPIIGLGMACDKALRRWVCPCCGGELPVLRTQYITMPDYTDCCPHCGHSLEETAAFHSTAAQTAFSVERSGKRQKRWIPAVVFGSLLLPYSAVMLLGCYISFTEEPQYGGEWGFAISLVTLFAGILLLVLHGQKIPGEEKALISVEKSTAGLAGGIFVFLLGLGMLFAATAVSTVGPVDGFFIFMLVMSLFFFFWGVWSLLSYRCRKILLFPDGTLICSNSLGKQKSFASSEIASVRYSMTGSLHIHHQDGTRLFSFRSALAGAGALTDWLTAHCETVSVSRHTRRMKLAVPNQVPREPLEWKEEYRTPFHSHLKKIKAGLIILTLIAFGGGILPVFFLNEIGLTKSMLLVTLTPLLPVIYYLVFPGILSMNGKPRHATPQWKSMHISMPLIPLLLLMLWVVQVIRIVDEIRLTVTDHNRFLLLWLLLSALLITVTVIRTPKRLRGEGLVLFGIGLFLLSYGLTYSLNLAASSKPEHTPVFITESRIDTEDKEDPDYYLTVLLSDKQETELWVSPDIYLMYQTGQPLSLCERTSPLGIRMVKIHLQ